MTQSSLSPDVKTMPLCDKCDHARVLHVDSFDPRFKYCTATVKGKRCPCIVTVRTPVKVVK